MSDNRKPSFTFLLKKEGKKKSNKVEVYPAELFFKHPPEFAGRKKVKSTYRLKVDGKWYPKGERVFYWRTEIRDLLFRSINF